MGYTNGFEEYMAMSSEEKRDLSVHLNDVVGEKDYMKIIEHNLKFSSDRLNVLPHIISSFFDQRSFTLNDIKKLDEICGVWGLDLSERDHLSTVINNKEMDDENKWQIVEYLYNTYTYDYNSIHEILTSCDIPEYRKFVSIFELYLPPIFYIELAIHCESMDLFVYIMTSNKFFNTSIKSTINGDKISIYQYIMEQILSDYDSLSYRNGVNKFMYIYNRNVVDLLNVPFNSFCDIIHPFIHHYYELNERNRTLFNKILDIGKLYYGNRFYDYVLSHSINLISMWEVTKDLVSKGVTIKSTYDEIMAEVDGTDEDHVVEEYMTWISENLVDDE